jgi:hypothetical protein
MTLKSRKKGELHRVRLCLGVLSLLAFLASDDLGGSRIRRKMIRCWPWVESIYTITHHSVSCAQSVHDIMRVTLLETSNHITSN